MCVSVVVGAHILVCLWRPEASLIALLVTFETGSLTAAHQFVRPACQRGIGLYFSSVVVFLDGFGVRVMLVSQNELSNVFPSSVLLNSLRSIDASSR